MLAKGPLAEYPVVGIKVELNDGTYHDVDSSDMAFKLTARECFRENFKRMSPVLLEPLMLMEIECPEEFQGGVVGQIASKRGMVVSTNTENNVTTIIAHVPLSETFGYSTDLRSNTQGQGSFSMELYKYAPVPGNIQEDIIADRRKSASSSVRDSRETRLQIVFNLLTRGSVAEPRVFCDLWRKAIQMLRNGHMALFGGR